MTSFEASLRDDVYEAPKLALVHLDDFEGLTLRLETKTDNLIAHLNVGPVEQRELIYLLLKRWCSGVTWTWDRILTECELVPLTRKYTHAVAGNTAHLKCQHVYRCIWLCLPQWLNYDWVVSATLSNPPLGQHCRFSKLGDTCVTFMSLKVLLAYASNEPRRGICELICVIMKPGSACGMMRDHPCSTLLFGYVHLTISWHTGVISWKWHCCMTDPFCHMLTSEVHNRCHGGGSVYGSVVSEPERGLIPDVGLKFILVHQLQICIDHACLKSPRLRRCEQSVLA